MPPRTPNRARRELAQSPLCVVGGLLGARYGLNAVPARWQQVLRGHNLVMPLRDQLTSLRELGQQRNQRVAT